MEPGMIEPSLAVQTAIRTALINAPAVLDLVPADHIRAGSTRPDKLPAIVIANGSTAFHGRAAAGQYVASVFLDLHVWALEAGQDAAKQIGAAVHAALVDAPASTEVEFDAWAIVRTVWPRDPNPEYGHGVISIEATVRWRL
jgi:hypothetical protein